MIIRKIGMGSVITGLATTLAGGGCATHATQVAHVGEVATPKILHISHAQQNLDAVRKSGMVDEKLLSTEVSNGDEFAQLWRDTVVATNSCLEAEKACTLNVSKVPECGEAYSNIQECPTWVQFCKDILATCVDSITDHVNAVITKLTQGAAPVVKGTVTK